MQQLTPATPAPLLVPALLGLLPLLAACNSMPPAVPEPEQVLAAAEGKLASGQPAECRDTLLALKDQAFPRRLRDRFDLAVANAHFALGDTWEAFEVAERFPDRHPHSPLRHQVVELVWQVGKTMATSGRGFLFFWSDRRGARTVLEHLITRHPDTPRLADALRLLGDMAYEDGGYTLAQERFRDLMRKRPDSEWVVYARFRFAMSIVAGLQGLDYDLDQMEHATRELQAFLDSKPENPEFVRIAGEALQKLLEWRCERHWRIAEFYHTVGNSFGRKRHLELASSQQFQGCTAHQRASQQLGELASPTVPPAGAGR